MIYIVQQGDTLSAIARRFGTTVDAILRVNPQITDPNRIFPGQAIRIPATPPQPGVINYVVQPGDTLFFIARRFGTTIDAILRLNPQITDPNRIFPGQIIRVPVGGTTPPPGRTYTVQPGDTLFLIAQRFGTTIEAILRVNPQITNPDLIFPGQVINLP